MSTPEIPQPHDGLVRSTFGQMQLAAAFFRNHLPEAVAEALDWDAMRLVNASFVSESLRQTESDLLYQIPWKESSGASETNPEDRPSLFIYILFEHQSTPDKKMPWRLLKSTVRIWERFETDHPNAPGLPPIIPFVLANAAGEWKLSRQFHDQIQWPESPELRALLKGCVPNFEHMLFDLAKTPLGALHGGPVMRLTLGLLKFSRQGVDGTTDWAIPIIVDSQLLETAPAQLKPIILYLLNIPNLKRSDFEAKLKEHSVPSKTADSIMTLADQYKAEGRQEGLVEGRQEGRTEGREEGELFGQVRVLQQILHRPVDDKAHLETLSKDQLEALLANLKRDFGLAAS